MSRNYLITNYLYSSHKIKTIRLRPCSHYFFLYAGVKGYRKKYPVIALLEC